MRLRLAWSFTGRWGGLLGLSQCFSVACNSTDGALKSDSLTWLTSNQRLDVPGRCGGARRMSEFKRGYIKSNLSSGCCAKQVVGISLDA